MLSLPAKLFTLLNNNSNNLTLLPLGTDNYFSGGRGGVFEELKTIVSVIIVTESELKISHTPSRKNNGSSPNISTSGVISEFYRSSTSDLGVFV